MTVYRLCNNSNKEASGIGQVGYAGYIETFSAREANAIGWNTLRSGKDERKVPSDTLKTVDAFSLREDGQKIIARLARRSPVHVL